ncbi:MAG: Holliday junction branch migration protein RuvA [Proteobacteria bacterium]|nr:Holliday junction branch migration protein RuvA [Pseudomonadota bacterium]
MIAKLAGVLDSVGEDWAVIDVAGVGYLVYCSARTLRTLPAPGVPVRLFVETHVRQDHIHLYGFVDESERDWFRLLQTVQGVGARVALAILAALGPSDLVVAIAAQDKAAVSQANGVGGKLAGRIVAELRDTVGDLALGTVAALDAARVHGGPEADAVSALVNLGYRRTEAVAAVAGAARQLGAGARLDALVRTGLQELGR